MRHAREIIHLKFSACVPTREIARRLGIAASTVQETPNVGWAELAFAGGHERRRPGGELCAN